MPGCALSGHQVNAQQQGREQQATDTALKQAGQRHPHRISSSDAARLPAPPTCSTCGSMPKPCLPSRASPLTLSITRLQGRGKAGACSRVEVCRQREVERQDGAAARPRRAGRSAHKPATCHTHFPAAQPAHLWGGRLAAEHGWTAAGGGAAVTHGASQPAVPTTPGPRLTCT